MADAFSWMDLGRWLYSLRRALPDRLLRWAWSDEQLLSKIQTFAVAQPPPYFFVRTEREHPELTSLGFHVVMFTPFTLAIVAASTRVILNSPDLFVHDQRFVTEVPLPAYIVGAFHICHSLTGAQAHRLRAYPRTSARLRMEGGMTLRTPFGERRKPISCDLDARIDR